jgi:hypothetical protein
LPPAPPLSPKPRGRRPSARPTSPADPDAATGWLYHELIVSGPADELEKFAAAARGTGVVPWRLDFGRIEEDVFILAAAQPPELRRLSIAGCRILARQFRQRVEAHHARAVGRIGASRACSLDLQALLPIADPILALGPTDPASLAWLTEHWGTERLRQVSLLPRPRPGRRLPIGHTVVGYGFFSLGGTPQAAIASLAARWPALAFSLRSYPPD